MPLGYTVAEVSSRCGNSKKGWESNKCSKYYAVPYFSTTLINTPKNSVGTGSPSHLIEKQQGRRKGPGIRKKVRFEFDRLCTTYTQPIHSPLRSQRVASLYLE